MTWLVAIALAAAPTFLVDPQLRPGEAVQREAEAAWGSLERTFRAAAGADPAKAKGPLSIHRAQTLRPDQAGQSRFGWIELRQNRDGVLDVAAVVGLRHELAHQFLWVSCPASAEDRLFHEAFAIATSGELASWNDGRYLSASAARTLLSQTRDLDRRDARRAIARLLADAQPDPNALPRPVAARLRTCAGGGPWRPFTVGELAASPVIEGDAFVVIDRHSGATVWERGEVRKPLPFGSTLKPFVAAAAESAPALAPDTGRAEWIACGDHLPPKMDLPAALLRSCNGYFLDWAARAPGVSSYGAWGPALVALGLTRLPSDITEAIGLRPNLAISPLGMARAYRLLAEARPDLIEILRGNVREGTLAGLVSSGELDGLATKTGTVRGADLRPDVGWIVAVDDDVVAVIARHATIPRTLAADLARAIAPFRNARALSAARVQTFGLLPPGEVKARCADGSSDDDGVGFVAAASGPVPVPAGFSTLVDLARRGPVLCLTGPWRVRFPGLAVPHREYAGIFTASVPPPYVPPPGSSPTAREVKARRGSELVFRTQLGLYAAGVLAAEDSEISGEARAALLALVAHNAGASRHPGRPVCDTTHCQVFLGTKPPQAGDLEALSGEDPLPPQWMTFARGGDEPWREVRSLREVAAVLGGAPSSLSFSGGQARFVVSAREGEAAYDDARAVPCERLRGPLKLPSCPDSARIEADRVAFAGKGEGHGMGLDVEKAKRGREGRSALLRDAAAHAD